MLQRKRIIERKKKQVLIPSRFRSPAVTSPTFYSRRLAINILRVFFCFFFNIPRIPKCQSSVGSTRLFIYPPLSWYISFCRCVPMSLCADMSVRIFFIIFSIAWTQTIYVGKPIKSIHFRAPAGYIRAQSESELIALFIKLI